MAIMGRVDQMVMAQKGISMTIAPFGAVCAVLFSAPSSPAARCEIHGNAKQRFCVVDAEVQHVCGADRMRSHGSAGTGAVWARRLARSSALAASIAFMIITRSSHPPARDGVLFEGQLQVKKGTTCMDIAGD
ncbi:hypothetical protein QJS10_CPB21g00289 [Acorus calamus]|uniref:HPP transmembrane region domain-containing protein n=1 Tax=Acorus calamus TaxID=4465 RepID=A0AAV9C6F8_ACOCL|nr:hypothetical protein QJS10_CPB21g00289 [Acorus calamus]